MKNSKQNPNRASVHAIAFDFVGVFFDFQAADYTMRQLAIARDFGRFITDEAHLDYYEEKFGSPREQLVEEIRYICEHAYKIREPDIFDKIPPFKFAAASNHLSYAMDWFKKQPVSEHFQVFFASGSLGLAKPDSRFFMALCEALEEKPENVLFVDDTLRHVLGARSCGLQALHFDSKKGLSEEVLRYLSEND